MSIPHVGFSYYQQNYSGYSRIVGKCLPIFERALRYQSCATPRNTRFYTRFSRSFCSSRSSVILLLLSYKMIAILYRTMGCKPRADLYPSPCLSRREDQPSGRRNTQCVTTAAGSVGAFSRFLPRWAGRGFWDKMQVQLRADLASLSRAEFRTKTNAPNRSSLRPPAT